MASPLSPHNATTQLTTFKSYVALIADPTPGSMFALTTLREHNYGFITRSKRRDRLLSKIYLSFDK